MGPFRRRLSSLLTEDCTLKVSTTFRNSNPKGVNVIPFRRKSLVVALGPIVGVVGAASLTGVIATAHAQQAEVQKGERIEVTGSSIKRIDAETALPVQIISRDEIRRTGAQNAEELLKTISAFASANSTMQATASGTNTGSVSTVSLRGLGGQRTLVLINGRRSTVFGGVPGGTGDTAVDVNSIPLAAIDRIEVLKDGASAIYGSDAVAGVINFILRTDYQGGEVTALYGNTTQGGASVKKLTGVVGFGDLSVDRFNVMVNANFQKESPLYGRDRKFASSGVHVGEGDSSTSGNSFPGNIVQPNGRSINPAALAGNCSPSIIDPLFASNLCRYDPAGEVALIPDSERTSAFIGGRFALTENVLLYADIGLSHNVTKVTIQPSPISDQFPITPGNPYIPAQQALFASYPALATAYPNNFSGLSGTAAILLPPSSPYYPTAFVASNIPSLIGQPLLIRYRSYTVGGRSFTDVNDVGRFVLGTKGTIGAWDFDTALLYNESKLKESTTAGIEQYSKILPLLNSGLVNPFGMSSPVVEDALKQTVYHGLAYRTKTSISQFDLKASRDVYQLPAGAIAIALGGNVRREKYDLTPSLVLQQGDTTQYGGNNIPTSAARNVESAFAEMSVPLMKSLEADVAVRFDKYERVGTTTNPKVSLRFQPAQEVLVRGSWGKGFRAPALTDLYAPAVTGVSAPNLNDPFRCPATGSALDCGTQFTIKTGGQPALKPERSESYTAGIVIEPTRDVHLAVDFFKINLSNSIVLGGIGAPVILSSPQLAQQFAQYVTRGAPDPTVPGGYGSIVSIDQTNANLFDIRTRGIDVDFKLRFAANESGRWTFGINGTYFQKYDIQLPDGTYFSAVANNTFTGVNGVIPRWKSVTTLGWDRGPFAASLAYNFQSAYLDNASTVSGDQRRVGTYETFDGQASYSGMKDWQFTLGMRNILNRDPPYANADAVAQFQSGYDSTYGDPRGRFIYTSATYKFK